MSLFLSEDEDVLELNADYTDILSDGEAVVEKGICMVEVLSKGKIICVASTR